MLAMRKLVAGLLASLMVVSGMCGLQMALAPTVAAGPIVSSVAADSFAGKQIKKNWPWYVTRATGMIAAVLLLLLILSGVGLLTGYTYKLLEPLPAWAAHRALGLAFGVSTLLHVFCLLFDKYIGFTVFDLLVPFRSAYKPVTIGGVHLGSLYVALGIFALYAIIAVIITSLLWINNKPKPWRALHYLSYVALVFVFIHGLFLGTDIDLPVVKVFWILGAIAAVVSISIRLYRARTIAKTK